MKALLAEEVGAANRRSLEALLARVEDLDQTELFNLFPIIKTEKCYSEEFMKIAIHCTEAESKTLLTGALKLVGAKLLVGRPPAGYLENELSDWMVALASKE